MKKYTAEAVKRTCELYAISQWDLSGSRRHAEICEARFALIVALHHLDFQWRRIGRIINRDHTTIMHGYSRGADMCRRKVGFADIVAEIMDAAVPGSSTSLVGPWQDAA